jgi:hypothetical protein
MDERMQFRFRNRGYRIVFESRLTRPTRNATKGNMAPVTCRFSASRKLTSVCNFHFVRIAGKPELIHFTTVRLHGGWSLRSSPSLLAATLTLLSGGFQLAVALSVNLDLLACKHIVWRQITDGAVQPDVVITVHILLDQAFCIFE